MSKDYFKAQAAHLVKFLSDNHKIRLTHSRSLEAIAAIHGCRNWNTLLARKTRSDFPAEDFRPSQSVQDGSAAPVLLAPIAAQHGSLTLAPTHADTAFAPQAAASALSPAELSNLVFETFVKNLGTLPIRTEHPASSLPVGWKRGSCLYLLEIKLREALLSRLPLAVQRQLTPTLPRRGPHPLSVCLYEALEKNEWLIRSLDIHHLRAELPLWNAVVGKYLFNGTIIVDVPPRFSTCCRPETGPKPSRLPDQPMSWRVPRDL